MFSVATIPATVIAKQNRRISICALVFEAEKEEDNIMRRKPREPDAPLFSRSMIGWSVFQGALAFALLGAVYLTATFQGMAEADTCALIFVFFVSLIMAILALILVNRSFGISLAAAFMRKNVALRYVLAAVAVVTALIVFVPALRLLLKFGAPDWAHFAAAVAIGGILLVSLEWLKPAANRQRAVTS